MASFFDSLKGLFHSKPADAGAAKGAAPQSAKVAAPPPAPPLAIPQLMAVLGTFPLNAEGGTAAFTLGMIQSFAGTASIFGAPRANGQLIAISSNQVLYSVIGATYGGNAVQNYALPNLKGSVAAGGANLGQAAQGTLTMTMLIAATATMAPPLGTVIAFGGNYAPAGWLVADGSLLSIEENVELFQTIGTAFGGNGQTSFALPALVPVLSSNPPLTVALGAGTAPGRPPVALGQRVPNAVGTADGLGLNFLICVQGLYPAASGDGSFPSDEPYLGQMLAFAGKAPPQGWALCDGSLLAISGNQALYTLLGTTYGGDGKTNFALPDLRGRAMAGV